jgi:hypothetical protein
VIDILEYIVGNGLVLTHHQADHLIESSKRREARKRGSYDKYMEAYLAEHGSDDWYQGY